MLTEIDGGASPAGGGAVGPAETVVGAGVGDGDLVGVGVGLAVALAVGLAVGLAAAGDTRVGDGAVLGVDCPAFATGLEGRWPGDEDWIANQPPRRAMEIATASAIRPMPTSVL
jgi:hypothetical protein